jgi:hypothetical protein
VQRLDRCRTRAACLSHDQLNVLGFQARLIHRGVTTRIVGRRQIRHAAASSLHLLHLCRLLLGLELSGGLRLRTARTVVRLGFSKDHVGITGGALEDVWLVDDKEHILGLLDRHTDDSLDGSHAELLHGLARFLFVAVLQLGVVVGIVAAAASFFQLGNVIVVVLFLELGNVVVVRVVDFVDLQKENNECR